MKLIEKLKRVFLEDEYYWANAEFINNVEEDEMQRIIDARYISGPCWNAMKWLTDVMGEDATLKAAWLGGYVPEDENEEHRKKREDYIWEYAKHVINQRGAKLYFIPGIKSARIQSALDILKENDYVYVVRRMRDLGYQINIPECAMEEWEALQTKRNYRSKKNEETIKSKKDKAIHG